MELIALEINASLNDALIYLDENSNIQTLLVQDNQKIVGTLTESDIRKGLIKGFDQKTSIEKFMNKDFLYLLKGKYDLEKINDIKAKNVKIIPVLNEDLSLFKVLNFDEIKNILPLDAVIMAGGLGNRLMPLTKDTPKPMLKVGGKPILDYNIDLLRSYGIQHITLSVKYLKEVIIDYYNSKKTTDTSIKFVSEDKPLGTLGAIKQVETFHNDYILVMNSDLLTNIDLELMFNELVSQNADMIVASTNYKVQIPYGVIETKDNKITKIVEKPTYSYYSSSGIYMIKKELLQFIEPNSFLNATDFLEQLIQLNRKVVHYPIKKYWLDIGNHSDFKKAEIEVDKVVF